MTTIDLRDTVTVRIGTSALYICGLDDDARFPDVERTRFNARLTACTGKGSAIQELVDEIYDRATEGADGYNHPANEKRILRRELKALREAYGLEPRV